MSSHSFSSARLPELQVEFPSPPTGRARQNCADITRLVSITHLSRVSKNVLSVKKKNSKCKHCANLTCSNAKVKAYNCCQLRWADTAVALLSLALLNICTSLNQHRICFTSSAKNMSLLHASFKAAGT